MAVESEPGLQEISDAPEVLEPMAVRDVGWPQPFGQCAVAAKGFPESQVLVVQQQQFICRRIDDLSGGCCLMAAGGKIDFLDSRRVKDSQLHHIQPWHATLEIRRQIRALRWKPEIDHLEAQSRDGSDAVARAARKISWQVSVPEQLVDISHDHPVGLVP